MTSERHACLHGVRLSSQRRITKKSGLFILISLPQRTINLTLYVINRLQLEALGQCILHTSAKARLTSVAVWIRIPDADRHQNLNICSLVHCQPSMKISCKSVRKFLRKVALTDKQTNNYDYIFSVAGVTNVCELIYAHMPMHADFINYISRGRREMYVSRASVCPSPHSHTTAGTRI